MKIVESQVDFRVLHRNKYINQLIARHKYTRAMYLQWEFQLNLFTSHWSTRRRRTRRWNKRIFPMWKSSPKLPPGVSKCQKENLLCFHTSTPYSEALFLFGAPSSIPNCWHCEVLTSSWVGGRLESTLASVQISSVLHRKKVQTERSSAFVLYPPFFCRNNTSSPSLLWPTQRKKEPLPIQWFPRRTTFCGATAPLPSKEENGWEFTYHEAEAPFTVIHHLSGSVEFGNWRLALARPFALNYSWTTVTFIRTVQSGW